MTAVFSPCASYRYRLERRISLFGPTVAVIMVNPSVADAELDDPTIRRVVGFAKKHAWGRVIVGNVFARRSADVRMLRNVRDPVGPHNLEHLRSIFEESQAALFAWGSLAKLPPPLREVWRQVWDSAESAGLPIYCLGLARDGHPRHPLMLSYSAELATWQPPTL